MDITIHPQPLRGDITILPSKSQAHRLLICAAFADGPTTLICPQTNADILATIGCLLAFGAQIDEIPNGFQITPGIICPASADLFCGESGSTLRFLLPIAGALGIDTTFHLEGRLPNRPLSPLWEEMVRMGCRLSRPTADTVRCQGKLQPGKYSIAGNVSSQFISGLLMAFPLIDGICSLEITGTLESAPYVALTEAALALFPGRHTPGRVLVEGDWSNGAFFLAAKFLNPNSELNVLGLDRASVQGDRAAAHWIPRLCREKCIIDARDIPDLVPILSVVAACGRGAVFENIQRLRLKESDRVASVIAMLTSLGGRAEATEDTLTVYGTGLVGGTVDTVNDHRIAMSAAIASSRCTAPVTILDARCVNKSYPAFWEEFTRLGGNYEQHLR